MSLEPLLSAPLPIQIHAASAMFAIVLGPFPLYRKRGDMVHKVVGYLWVVAMVGATLSSFFIYSFAIIGPFSPLHGLAILALWSLWRGISFARAKNIPAHRATFRSLYWTGLMIAGLANFLPDRRINEAVFNGQDELGFIVIAVGSVVILAIVFGERIKARLAGVQVSTS
ncbi:Uncharacterized membrane protein [Octadecabacter temperatus]|uniref:Uncharacterized protein n=1 Tax=Octadecabacter temperatus TaxID=1458307 RepID=A0A0K0Y6Z5_9RHOB|nr:DUF2306 domain-containing protein [Octadecabacter temperatus]AKS46723.1 hypothetical protein OSB_21860 [Octadecabacter temperatus]SIO20014.1 Uncharacterized membrane protein [Octadecabacter temperatus]